MSAPLYTAADYLGALQALMPRGRVWPRDLDSVQAKVLAGLTRSYAVQNGRANQLLVDAFPTTAQELLPEWEATLGLPNAAAGPSPSIVARQTLVVARLLGPGGQSVDALTRYAAVLGYTVSITSHAPFRCGQSWCGEALGGEEQMFALTVTTSGDTVTPFGQYGVAVLQSELQRVVPPFSVLNFNFT